jgi:hypothetical protein
MKGNLKKLLLRYSTPLQITLAVVIGLGSGLLTNLLTNKLQNTTTIWEGVKGLAWWNLLLLLVIGSASFQIYLVSLPKRLLRVTQDELISRILEAACKTMIYPRMNRHIRAIVTIREGRSGQRRTKYNFNADSDPERVASYPLEFGVTGKAYKLRAVVVEELPIDHHGKYKRSIKDCVLPEIRSILAAPILGSLLEEEEPLGVLAFDSVLPLEDIEFNKLEARELAQRWADILAQIIITTEI